MPELTVDKEVEVTHAEKAIVDVRHSPFEIDIQVISPYFKEIGVDKWFGFRLKYDEKTSTYELIRRDNAGITSEKKTIKLKVES